MKNLYKLLLILSLILSISCSKEKSEITKITQLDQELELIETYKEAMENFNKGDYFFAAKKFLESELLFPQSKWAPKSALMASYSYYMTDYYILLF